jgi:hypothetical protein
MLPYHLCYPLAITTLILSRGYSGEREREDMPRLLVVLLLVYIVGYVWIYSRIGF